MTHFVFALLSSLAMWAQTTWIICYFFARPPWVVPAAKVYVALTRYLCLGLWVFPIWANMQMVIHPGVWFDPLLGVAGVLIDLYWARIMWKTRNDDDDFWRKTRKKLKSLVKVVGGKLVVVPAPQPVRT